MQEIEEWKGKFLSNPNNIMSAAQPAETNTKSNAPIDEDLPPQLHAGKVGYGPNYRSGPTLEEKVRGLKEELLGKATHNKDRVQHGHEIRTGEEKRKHMTGEDEPNPFQGAEEDHSLQSPAAGIKKGDSDDQSNTGSTAGLHSTSSAAHDTHTTNNNATTASDVNQGVPTPMNKVTQNTGALDVNQSVPTPTNKMSHNTGASDVNQSLPAPTNRATHNTGTSDVNQSLPTSTTNNNISNATTNSVPSTATNDNMPSTTSTHETHPTGTTISGHNNWSSSQRNDTTGTRDGTTTSDTLSQSSYKPAPEKVTFDLNDKKNQERAATVAPHGTDAAEHQRRGGNVSDNKYLN